MGVNWLGVNWLGVNWLGVNSLEVNWWGVNWLGVNWWGVNWWGVNWLGRESIDKVLMDWESIHGGGGQFNLVWSIEMESNDGKPINGYDIGEE